MIEQIQTFKGNTIAVEAIDSFTETDAQLLHKFFEEKLTHGFHDGLNLESRKPSITLNAGKCSLMLKKS